MDDLYLPVPFRGNWPESSRPLKECEARYQMAKRALLTTFGSLADLTMVEVGSMNGFFPFRFLQDGGAEAVVVERDDRFRKFSEQLAKDNDMEGFKAFPSLKQVDQSKHFEIGFYFDIHGHEGVNCLPWLAPRVDILICTVAGDGNKYNAKFYDELKNYFVDIQQAGVSISNRAILICAGAKQRLETAKPKKVEESVQTVEPGEDKPEAQPKAEKAAKAKKPKE